MLKTVDFHLKPLPGSGIWTGSDESTRMTALKGTSLIGSMRFWTEALLRSFGHRVCDCTAQHEIFDKEKYEKGQDGTVCAACHTFGCTGLARAFNIHVRAKNPTSGQARAFNAHAQAGNPGFSEEKKTFRVTVPGRDPACYAFAQGWTEELTLALSCLRPLTWPCEEHRHQNHVALPPEMLLATFLMLEYGTLGAMDQYGRGLVDLLNREDLVPAIENCLKCVKKGSAAPEKGYASLQDFYYFRGVLDRDALKKLCNCAIALQTTSGERLLASDDSIIRIRRLLRENVRVSLSHLSRAQELRHWICGSLKEPSGSHISIGVSGGMLHGWGWVPRTGIAGYNIPNWPDERENILQTVFSCMKKICSSLEWKEFASRREANAPQDWSDYVQKMIVSPWRNAS